MKRIINGKRYDTKTAACIAEWDNGCYGGDFSACEETLYHTTKGNWFLYGKGGPLSSYAISLGDNSTGGSSAITPLSKEEAREWMEEHECTAELEEHFPDSIQDA